MIRANLSAASTLVADGARPAQSMLPRSSQHHRRPRAYHSAPGTQRQPADGALRRGVDLTVALVGLAIATPVLAVLAVAVQLTSKGPWLFRQTRVGRGEQPFEMWKLRTMVADTNGAGSLVSGPGDPRITRMGAWLRPRRLDELPQLVNLLRGDLTLFGSRPEVPRFIPYYTGAERQILQVRPGIIGPGAVLFASGQDSELDAVDDADAYYVAHHLHSRLALDLHYFADRTVRRDLTLLIRALGVCVRNG